MVEALINTRLRASLHIHDVLHGFRYGRGTGTDIMELKLSQELARIDQDPLFLVFMDLRKVYNTVDRDHLLITLEEYGVGPRMCGLLETFWEFQHVVPRQKGLHGPAFPVTRGTTQGGLVSLTLFNVVVYNVIRTWMKIMVEDQRVAHDGLVETIWRCLGAFYANNSMVGSRGLDCLQHAMNVMFILFRRYCLAANVTNLCTMRCQPKQLRTGVSEEAMTLK